MTPLVLQQAWEQARLPPAGAYLRRLPLAEAVLVLVVAPVVEFAAAGESAL